MRQVTSLHRTLVVLAVGLLALAAPLDRICGRRRPCGPLRPVVITIKARRKAGLALLARPARVNVLQGEVRPAQAGSAALDECHVIEQRTDTGGIDNVSLPLVEGQGACEHVLSVAATSREAVDLREIHVHLGTAVQRVAGFCELERIGRERECLVVSVILGGDLGPYWHPENARIEVVGGANEFPRQPPTPRLGRVALVYTAPQRDHQLYSRGD